MQFCALVVRNGDHLLAGVPLGIRKVRSPCGTIRVAEIVGTAAVPTRGMGLTDKACFVARPNAPDSLRLLVTTCLNLFDRTDVLLLKGLDRESLSGHLTNSSLKNCSNVHQESRSVSPYLFLNQTWEEYLKSRSKNFRKQLTRNIRKFDAIRGAKITRMTPEDSADVWLSELLSVNRRSRQAEQGTNLFRHPALQDFFVELIPELTRNGWVNLHFLRLDGWAMAYELCFDFKDRLFSYNSGFDSEIANLSPGTLLTAAIIEKACQSKKCEYDFLRGDEAYKYRWTDSCRQESELIALSGNLRSRLFACLDLDLRKRLKSNPWIEQTISRVNGFASRIRYSG
jgi:CelD/BcsL family acetyltransferase involved in cellulose biosynthesis